MADHKNDKPSEENPSLIDSDVYLKSVFSEELKAIAAQDKKETAPKTSTETSADKKPKSPSQVEGVGRKKADLEIATEETKTLKSSSMSQAQVSRPRKVGFGGNFLLASDKQKVVLLSVLLIAAVTFLLTSLGIIDFSQFFGLSEPTKKASSKTRMAIKRPAPPISEKRPPTKTPTPETPMEEPVAVRQQPEPMPSPPEPAPDKTPPETASLKEPPRESQPPKWVERVYPYSVNLGSYRTPERMQKAVTTYGSLGLSLYWIQVDLGEKGKWFRLFTGFFRTRAEADAFIRENRIPDAFSRHTKYAVLIGAYKSEKELNTKRVELRAMGCSSYEVKDVNGAYWLFTGAFYQTVRAQKHEADLASKGIQGEVVER